MPNLSSPEAAYYLLALTVPAVVFMYVRVHFTHGRMPKAAEAALHYLALTAAYYGITYPAILWAIATPGTPLTWWLGWLVLAFALPAVSGLVAGWLAQTDLIYRFLRKIGLKPVHRIPTAWEWKFSKCEPCWVAITLKNGNAYGAMLGDESLVSTEPNERDVYVEASYDIGDDGTWKPRGFGMLILGSEISTIEFSVPDVSESNGQITTTSATA